MTAPARPYCVYCGATYNLTLSCLVPDDTLYPGVQRMCADAKACQRRIHDGYHAEAPAPECHYCGQPLTPAVGTGHA